MEHDKLEANREIARRFVAGLSAGRLPDDLLAEDFTAWTTSSGASPGARYKGGIPLLASVFEAPPRYTVDAMTAEGERVAVEAHAEGVLKSGEPYANTYVFVLRIHEGRIVSLAEHFDPRPVLEKIMPLLSQAMAQRS